MRNRSVILLGVDSPIGLTIIRELGRFGIAVHGIGWSKNSIGLYSKYLASGHFRCKVDSELIEQINQLSTDYDCDWIMTVSESDIMLLDRNRPFLRPKPIIPGTEQLKAVLDKRHTLSIAAKIGINIPKTWNISNIDQLDEILNQLNYPLVLKWDNPHRVMIELAKRNLILDKYKYIHTETELVNYLKYFDEISEFPLIQEYCSGIGLGQMILMHEGEVHLKFQHQRLAEWPPEGGFSTVCESLPLGTHEALMEKSVALLKEINWSGPAMVEYRYDSEKKKAVLMEINGRFWGSLPLAHHARAHFALAYYMLIAENKTMPASSYSAGIKCRFIFPEIKRLGRILFSAEKIQNKSIKFNPFFELAKFISDFFSIKNSYYVFAPTDPKPFLMDLYLAARKFIR
ncbi:MAG: carboxylate--amine ligase [Methylomonas sp.]|nr:MAG: carboxylate--amine ligase [Methylomonas sp.]